jgi:L-ascorbate metabolism protein UlaG (beta-lactamase superfamily)
LDGRNDCYAEGVPGHPIVVNALEVARNGGWREVNGLHIDAIEAMESVIYKTHPDQNGMYRFTVDGVRIGHMGDVGNPLMPAQWTARRLGGSPMRGTRSRSSC